MTIDVTSDQHIISNDKEPMLMPFQYLPFNGDEFIEETILWLKSRFGVNTIIETGTFLGYTTKWLSENFERVFTVEINPKFYAFAIKRLEGKKNVVCKNDSSVNMLSNFLSICDEVPAIFLDAHWNEFCPLKDELRLIAESHLKPIIAIHDFRVPNQDELGYDTYNGQPFVFEWIQKEIENIYGYGNYEHHYNSNAKSSGAKRGIIYIYPILKDTPTIAKSDEWILRLPYLPLFKKYSQCGEEGILEFILNSIGHGNKKLVDIGAWDGTFLSNTKYFMEERGYSGLLMDGNNHGNTQVKQEWITRDNICDLMAKYGCPQYFSLLSFDLDGNDYDILSSMLKIYRPRVIVCEINTDIPENESKKIKYNSEHIWTNDDYFGFSFAAAQVLARNNKYRIVCQHAWNLYLVRNDLLLNPDADINVPFQPIRCHAHNSIGEWEDV